NNYQFAIQSHNDAGWGQAGPPSESVKAVTNPGVVTSGTLSTTNQPKTIHLQFTQPSDGGDTITSYLIDGKAITAPPVATGQTQNLDVGGYTDGQTVTTVAIAACNSYRSNQK